MSVAEEVNSQLQTHPIVALIVGKLYERDQFLKTFTSRLQRLLAYLV